MDKWFQDRDAFLGMVGEHRELNVEVRRIRRHGDSVISNGGVSGIGYMEVSVVSDQILGESPMEEFEDFDDMEAMSSPS